MSDARTGEESGRVGALERRLQCATDELVQFKYHVSHDLNAPIASARGLLGLIAEDLAEGRPDDLQEMVGETVAQLARLENLIDDLMSLARGEAVESSPVEIDLPAFIDEIAASLKLHSRELETSVSLSYDERTLRTDRVRLRQVLANLIANARKFRDPGEIAPSIEVRVERRGAGHRVSLIDNGIGMSEDVAARAFDMFTRGSASHPGHGLGLYIVHKHVERLGGTVRVAHRGKPTVVEIDLP